MSAILGHMNVVLSNGQITVNWEFLDATGSTAGLSSPGYLVITRNGSQYERIDNVANGRGMHVSNIRGPGFYSVTLVAPSFSLSKTIFTLDGKTPTSPVVAIAIIGGLAVLAIPKLRKKILRR